MKLNLDSPVLDYVNTLLSYIVLNLLFILCCIPVITIGPAVAALYAVMLREARREYGYLYRSFLRAFREMFFQALGMSLFFVAFCAFYFFFHGILVFLWWGAAHGGQRASGSPDACDIGCGALRLSPSGEIPEYCEADCQECVWHDRGTRRIYGASYRD